ncbi:MAG TPA: P1 family peptidase [bacterium]|nr:P1 family peptidase [bacterium]
MTAPSITNVPGIAVGQATDVAHLTGCTVVLCEAGAVGGVAVLGGAPGTRETDLLRPDAVVDRVHAVLLSGGSAFGLAAADGVVRVLEHRGIGFDTAAARVPIVPAAVLYDLAIGEAAVRPDAAMGEAACRDARSGPIEEGNAGAGTGATVGKLLGAQSRMKAGVGTWSMRLPSGVTVGALVATNAFGDVVDPRTGAIVAGARDPGTGGFLGTAARLVAGIVPARRTLEHTTIGVVATDAPVTKADAARLAVAAHTGLARAVSPSHTSADGDTFFALGTAGNRSGSSGVEARLALEAAVAAVVVEAVLRSVRLARSAGGAPGLAG